MKLVFSFFLIVCLFSCGNNNEETVLENQEIALPKLSKESVQKLKFTEYLLDNKVKNKTKTWIKYNELEGVILKLKQADLFYFKDNHEILETLIKELKETIPSSLKSPAVDSRIIALETKLYKLESVVNLSNVEKTSIVTSIKEVLEAFSNLNLQLNKKIERESQKITKP